MLGIDRPVLEKGFAHASLDLKPDSSNGNRTAGKHDIVGAIITADMGNAHLERMIGAGDHAHLADPAAAAAAANRYAPAAKSFHAGEERFAILAAIALPRIDQLDVQHALSLIIFGIFCRIGRAGTLSNPHPVSENIPDVRPFIPSLYRFVRQSVQSVRLQHANGTS